MSARIILDLNSPVFLDDFLNLDKTELTRVVQALKKIRGMDWNTFMGHRGSRWEAIAHMTAQNGMPAHSFRLTQKHRALAYRDGVYLRVLSLHLDHDSAYRSR